MNLFIQTGGEGLSCWNQSAFEEYADQDQEKAKEVLGAAPSVIYHAGAISCQGCQLKQGGGAECTASLRNSLYAEVGARPSPADLAGDITSVERYLAQRPEQTPDGGLRIDQQAA